MRRSRRRTSGLQAAAVAAVCILFVMTALLGLYKCFSKEPTPKPEPVGGTLPSGEANAAEPGAAVPGKNKSGRKERFHTILLGGLDDENGGSDTNLLVAVDAKNGKIDVISLPRDTLLDVSWPVKKLNNAYHHGGFTQTMEEVSRLLGIPVDHYVTVDLKAFVELVDAIDGVDFDIPVEMDYDDPEQDLHIHFPAGPRRLTGEAAEQRRHRLRHRRHWPHRHPAGLFDGRGQADAANLKLGQDTLLRGNISEVGGNGPGAGQPHLAGGAGPDRGQRQHYLPHPAGRRRRLL